MCIYAWAVAALGVAISLQLRPTWRAQFLTIATLLLVNVFGQGLLNMLSRFEFAPQLWPGFSPYEISKLLPDSQYIEHLHAAQWPYSWRVSAMDNSPVWRTIFSTVSLSVYTTMAVVLVWHTLYRFETVANRARRSMTLPPIASKAIPEREKAQLIG
jgi:hypothetical protein